MNRLYQINTPENQAFLKELRGDLLRFGRRFPSPAGSSWYLGSDGTPLRDRPRETWITCRMVHVYSIGALLAGKDPAGDEWRRLAEAGVRGLRGELADKKSGGWYAGVRGGLTPEGAPDPRCEPLPDKQCYAHAFVILASSSALLAGIEGAETLFQEALAVYDRYFWNEAEGLSCDTWDTDFSACSSYRGLNANMHTVEAFLAAADAAPLPALRARAGRIIDHVIGWARQNEWRIPEHFSRSWEAQLAYHQECPADPFKPYGATPGHGIEWARLIVQWALSTFPENDPRAGGYLEAARQLYARARKDAWRADGAPGFVYTTDWDGTPIVHDRMHWTLAEAINTSAVLFRVCGDPAYADDYAEYLDYLDRQVVDHAHGSWFHQLDRDGNLLETVWPGKSDLYHAFQATLIPCAPPALSVASAAARGLVS